MWVSSLPVILFLTTFINYTDALREISTAGPPNTIPGQYSMTVPFNTYSLVCSITQEITFFH